MDIIALKEYVVETEATVIRQYIVRGTSAREVHDNWLDSANHKLVLEDSDEETVVWVRKIKS